MTTYFLVLILGMTGQRLALPTHSEAECLAHLEEFTSGRANMITTEGGIHLPIVGTVGCMTQEQIDARDGRGA